MELTTPVLQTPEVKLVEVILLRQPLFSGRTLKQMDFRNRYGLQVLGINRRGKTIFEKISQIRLKPGDQLLIQGHPAQITSLEESNNFRIISTLEHKTPNYKRASLAIVIFCGVLLMAALKILSLPVAVLSGVLLTFLTRCIAPEDAYRMIERKTLIVIGSMLALGSAMEHTGTAIFLAKLIISLTNNLNPIWLLTAFFTLTLLLNQPVSWFTDQAVIGFLIFSKLAPY